MSFDLDRRAFFRFAAGGATGILFSGVGLEAISTLNAALDNEQVQVPDGPESWKTAVCWLCAGGCGLRVRLIGDRAVKIQGNPLHPVNHGGLCPKALAGLQELYHPDRLHTPLRNAGTRAKPNWQPISWDDAIAMLAERLRSLRERGEARGLVMLDRRRSGLVPRLFQRFLFTYGSPNYFVMPAGLDAMQAAVALQQGVADPIAFDLANARYVLSFGANLLEGWGSPVAVMRAFARWRDSASGRRAKLVQLESRLSMTAGRADEWVPMRAGTEAALALGIAHVLVSENLYDANFVREHTFGFEDWRDADGHSHMGFKTLVTSEYRLNDVAALTEVPAEVILRLAREAGQNRPAIALGDRQTSLLPGSTYAAMAVHSLNALLGSIGTPGGVLLQQSLPLPALPQAPQTEPIVASPVALLPASATELARNLASRRPYPAQVLMLHGADPVFSLPGGEAFRQALAAVPFVVSFTSFMDETAAAGDLILPVPVGLESWQDSGPPPTVAHAMVSVSPPAVRPRHPVRHPGDVLLALARALGGATAAALPFAKYEDYLRSQVDELYRAESGVLFSTTLEETWNRLMERSGWWAPTYTTSQELWEKMQEQGGWWEPTYTYNDWGRLFRTPSRKFEFYSQILAGMLRHNPGLAKTAGTADHACLPRQDGISRPTNNYPLLLLPIEQLPLAAGSGAHLPYLQQIAGAHLFEHWDSWLEINPETAREYGIADGDTVWVESPRGRVQVRARTYPGARPGVVHLPLGYGRKVGSPWACRGVNPLDLIEERNDAVTRLPLTDSTYVKVYRA